MQSKEKMDFHQHKKDDCIYVLALGGTIASKADLPTAQFYNKPSSNIEELVSLIPEQKNLKIISEQVLQKISHEITDEELLFIANKINSLVKKIEVKGIVVTQGTNCIEEIAYFINLVINTKKPIVFTGSYRPVNALGYDGVRNLYNSILVANSKNAIGMGVLICLTDSIISSRDASKLNPSIMEGFTVNGLGLRGYVHGNNVFIENQTRFRHTYLSDFNISSIIKIPKICILYGHLGMDATIIDFFINAGVDGIISAGMGSGYQPKKVTEALGCASKKGIIVVRCSRSLYGIVDRDVKIDDKFGFIAAGSLSPQKARILLIMALNKTKNTTDIQQIFDQY